MPVYRCLMPKGALSYEQRERIAVAFTDVHCDNSAAPRNFVQVLFMETDGSGEVRDTHGRGMLRYDTEFFVAGGNRAGRSPEMIERIRKGIVERLTQIAGVPETAVSAQISEAPASWTMEAGKILPDPGEEPEEWYR